MKNKSIVSWQARQGDVFIEACEAPAKPYIGHFKDARTGRMHKVYHLSVHPKCRPMHADGSLGEPQKRTCRNAVASMVGKRGHEYAPRVET